MYTKKIMGILILLMLLNQSFGVISFNPVTGEIIETDTLQSVTDRGSTTNNGITVNSLMTDNIYSSKTPLVTINDDLEVTGKIETEKTLELLNKHLIVSGRGDDVTQDVIMKTEDASGTYTGYWGINDGFGNMHIGLNFNEDGNVVGYGGTDSGATKILFNGHGADGMVGLNAMKSSANGVALDWDIGLSLDSSDNSLKIGDTADMISNSKAGLLQGEGKRIADSDGVLYSEVDSGILNNIFSDYNNFDAVTSIVDSALFRNIFTSKANTGNDGRIAVWAGVQSNYATDPTELAVAGINSFVYHTGTANIGARTVDDAPNMIGGQYGVRVQSNADVDTAGAVVGNSAILSGTATLVNSSQFLARGQDANEGTITNAYGLKVNNGDSTTGSIVNQYGVYIEDLTEGTNSNYAIHTGTGNVLLGDLAGTYTGGQAYVCVNDNGVIFASETNC